MQANFGNLLKYFEGPNVGFAACPPKLARATAGSWEVGPRAAWPAKPGRSREHGSIVYAINF
jgi:hypothetical protein